MRTAEIPLEYQPLIPGPPVEPKQLMKTACSSDGVTVSSWSKTWLKQVRRNKELVGGDFAEKGIGRFIGQYRNQSCIIAGSGPSLKINGAQLKDRGAVPLISCLHNFHFFEDLGVKPEFYISLDAGEVVLEEVSEGGKLSADEYWERTKDHTLLAYVGSHPDLIQKWKGQIYFFNASLPPGDLKKEIDELAGLYTYLGSGGNVLGACLYFAKAILGCFTVGFVGADLSFSYDKKFHGWDSKYDATLGHTLRVTDIYGVKRHTWQSYFNFKCWFEYVACTAPGFYVNCTEGGILGAYDQGNIAQFRYMDLKEFFDMINAHEHMRPQCENPRQNHQIMLF